MPVVWGQRVTWILRHASVWLDTAPCQWHGLHVRHYVRHYLGAVFFVVMRDLGSRDTTLCGNIVLGIVYWPSHPRDPRTTQALALRGAVFNASAQRFRQGRIVKRKKKGGKDPLERMYLWVSNRLCSSTGTAEETLHAPPSAADPVQQKQQGAPTCPECTALCMHPTTPPSAVLH